MAEGCTNRSMALAVTLTNTEVNQIKSLYQLFFAGYTQSQIKKAGKQLTTTGKKMALSPVPNIGQPQVCIRRMKNWKEKGHAINYQTLIDRLILQDKQ